MIAVPWNQLNVPKSLACEFLGAFARFEYALKVTRFPKRHGRYAEANWTAFGEAIHAKFRADATPELAAAVAYLLENPPMRQKYSPGEGLAWETLRVNGAATTTIAERVIAYVCCVRNNLFHGGKFMPQPAGSPERDLQLIRNSLVVLGALLVLDEKVQRAFMS